VNDFQKMHGENMKLTIHIICDIDVLT